MNPADLLDRAETLVREALAAGAGAAEAFLSHSQRTEVQVREGRIERTVRSDSLGGGLRVEKGLSQGFASGTDLSAPGRRRMAESALAIAAMAPEAPDARIPEAFESGAPSVLDIEDPAVREIGFEQALENARRAEEAALASHPAVRAGEGSSFRYGGGAVAIASSRGARQAWSGTLCSLSCSPVAARDGEQQRQYWYESRRFLVDLPPAETIGATAGRRAAMMLGARPLRSGRIKVVFDPLEGASFWASLVGALIGDAVRRKVSFLAGSVGRRVASSAVTFVDDPLLPRGTGSRPCDGEGLPTARRLLIDRGVMTSLLYDTRTGRKAGVPSTASAVRGYGSLPSPGAHAPMLAPGPLSPEALLAEAGSGLYVTQLIGFGTNLVTGHYSRGASGWWFEKGEPVHAVQGVTLSANLSDLLTGVTLVGNDRVDRSPAAAPTFLVEGLVASGAA